MAVLINVIRLASFLLTITIVIHALSSFVLSPWHPIRRTLDAFLEPMLRPIRRVVPTVGMFDFSPLVLLILVQLLETILIQLLLSLS